MARTILSHRASFTRHMCNRYARQKEEKKDLNVNMLKPWHSPVAAVMTNTVTDEEDADSDLITPHSDPGGTFTTDPTISTD